MAVINMEIRDMEELDPGTILTKVENLRRDLLKIKIQAAIVAMEKPHEVQILKRNIARLLTVKNRKA